MTTDRKNNDVSEIDDNDDESEKASGDDASTDTSNTAGACDEGKCENDVICTSHYQGK